MSSNVAVATCAVLICAFATSTRAQTVAAGASHTAVVTPDGRIWTWGSNFYGQLGESGADRHVPGLVDSLTNVTAVAAGQNYTLALLSDGTVRAWGLNNSGQLGDGTTTQRSTPVSVTGLTSVVAIAAGDQHSMALTSNGQLWTWGNNGYGQLGDGTTTVRHQPVLVSGLSSVTAIAAGTYHSLAVKSDGTAWGWGRNANGQLGNGTTTNTSSPSQMTGITTATGAAGGDLHSLILKSDGTVSASGANTYGQLGDGTTTQRTTPVSATGLSGITRLKAGIIHSIAVKSDGTFWGWGNNSYSQLGDGTNTSRSTAVQISSLTNVQLIGAGEFHTLAVTTTGVVSSWGTNTSGKLGDGSTQGRNSPDTISGANYAWKVGIPVFSVYTGTYSTEQTVVISSVTPDAEIHYTLTGADPTITDPSIVSGNSIAIDRTYTLKARAWRNDMPTSSVASAVYTLVVSTPSIAPSTGTYTAVQTASISISTAGATIRYTTDGSVPTTGSPAYAGPFAVDTTTTVKAVGFRDGWSSSATASAALTMNYGTLVPPTFSPAGGTFTNSVDVMLLNELAPTATIRYTLDGTTPTTSSPVYVGPLPITTTTTIKAKAYHPDFTTSAQSEASYTINLSAPTVSPASGTYDVAQLITVTPVTTGVTMTYTLNGAEPTSTDPLVPPSGTLSMGDFVLKVKAFRTGATASPTVTADYRVTGSHTPGLLAGGESHSLAARPDGVAWAWGDNTYAQLGNGTSGSSTSSTTAKMVPGLTGAVSLSAGDRHSVAVAAGGTVYAWGNNASGRLGDGTTTTRTIPTLISGVTAASVDAGGEHTLAVSTNGMAWAWGYNVYGQLGDGTTQNQLSPVQLTGLSNVSKVSGGGLFSSALRTDGSVWTWGRNSNGQLGLGDTTDRTTPALISGITTAVAIAAGEIHMLALLADGTVRAWGSNTNGRLGDGTQTQRTSPVSVSGLTGVTAIAAGFSHSLALKSDGSVYAWGANTYGQLGDGTTTQRLTPIQVPGLPQIQAIAAGYNHSLALGANGSVWVWGRNTSGQIGDGTTTSPRKSPVEVGSTGMEWKLPIVKLSRPSGIYTASVVVTVTVGDTAAVIHYTTNGVDPTESDPIVASGGTVAVDQSLTLKAKAWKAGAPPSEVASATYQLKVALPVITPASGRYAGAQTITISTTVPSSTLRYTLDGSEPTETSTVFNAPFSVADTRTIKARGYKSGWTSSDATAASFWILEGTLQTPTISPSSGSYTKPTLVTLASSDTNAVIRYRLDGVDPDEASPVYQFPLLVTRTTTVRARAFRAGAAASAVSTATLTFNSTGVSTAPTIASPGGEFATRQTVGITGAAGATIRYTTTGIDPTETDPVVPQGGLVTIDRAAVLKARAWESGLAASPMSRADFRITGAVAAGGGTILALASDATLWAWGANDSGAVGDGTTTSRSTPVAVLTGVKSVATSGSHSLAVKEDGSIWAWGLNSNGQLGDGTTTQRNAPVQVTGISDAVQVVAGVSHSLALTRDGRLWAWGDNGFGELGDGTTTDRYVPVQVIGLGGVTSIAAANSFSLAVERDGGEGGFVWAWGSNSYGQLGDGSTSGRLLPVRVIGLDSAVQVAAAYYASFARLADGSVRAWGQNDKGQLGNGSTLNSIVPVTTAGVANSRHIAAHVSNGLVVDRTGLAWSLANDLECMFGTSVPFYAHVQGVPYLMPAFTAGVSAQNGSSMAVLLKWDGTVWTTGTGYLGFGTYERYCGARAVPGFSLAPNGWLLTDGDGDGLPAWREYELGTDPLDVDTNDDGVSDGIEGSQPDADADPDEDADGIPSVTEIDAGTDPFRSDTDGDGFADGVDAFPLDPTRHDPPAPSPGDTTPPTITLTEPTTAVPRP